MRTTGSDRRRTPATGSQAAGQAELRGQGAQGSQRQQATQAAAGRALASGAARAAAPSSRVVRDLTYEELAGLNLCFQDLVRGGLSQERAEGRLAAALRQQHKVPSERLRWNLIRATSASPTHSLSWGAKLDTWAGLLAPHVGEEGAFFHQLQSELVWLSLQSVTLQEALDLRVVTLQRAVTETWAGELINLAREVGGLEWRDPQVWDVLVDGVADPLARAVATHVRSLVLPGADFAKSALALGEAMVTYSQECLADPLPEGIRLRQWSRQVCQIRSVEDGSAEASEQMEQAAFQLCFNWELWLAQSWQEQEHSALIQGLSALAQSARAEPRGRVARLLVMWLHFYVMGPRSQEGGMAALGPTLLASILRAMLPLLQCMQPTHEIRKRDFGYFFWVALALGELRAADCTDTTLEALRGMAPEWAKGSFYHVPVLLFTRAQGERLIQIVGAAGAMPGAPFLEELLALVRRGVPELAHWVVGVAGGNTHRLPLIDHLLQKLEQDPNTELPQWGSFLEWNLRGQWLQNHPQQPLIQQLQPSDQQVQDYLQNLARRVELRIVPQHAGAVLEDVCLALFQMGVLPPNSWGDDLQSHWMPLQWEHSVLRLLDVAPAEFLQPILTRLGSKAGLCRRLAQHLLGLTDQLAQRQLPSVERLETILGQSGGGKRGVLRWLVREAAGLPAALTPELREQLEVYIRQASGDRAGACQRDSDKGLERMQEALELAPLVEALWAQPMEELERSRRLETLLILSENGMARLTLGPELWMQLPDQAQQLLLQHPVLIRGVTSELWLQWLLGHDASCSQWAAERIGMVAGATVALLGAWCQRDELAQDERILGLLSAQSQRVDLFGCREVELAALLRRREILTMISEGERSRWFNWCVADQEGRLRKKIPQVALKLQESLGWRGEDWRWLLEALSQSAAAEPAPLALQLLLRGSHEFAEEWAQWWGALQPEGASLAVACLRLQTPVAAAGKSRLLQLAWSGLLPAAMEEKLLRHLKEMPAADLLEAAQLAGITAEPDTGRHRELWSQMVQKLARAWLEHPEPSSLRAVLQLLESYGFHNPLVSGQLHCERLLGLNDLMQEPNDQGLSRWVSWWLQGAEAREQELIDLRGLPLGPARSLPWPLSHRDLSWLLGRLELRPNRRLAEPLARALIGSELGQSGELAAWLVRLQQGERWTAALPLALSLWRAGLALSDADRQALLRALRPELGLPAALCREIAPLILGWEASELLPTLRAMLQSGEFAPEWLPSEQLRSLRKKLQQWGETLVVARSPKAAHKSTPSPAAESPSSLRGSPATSSSAAGVPAPRTPEMLFHPRFVEQCRRLSHDHRVAVRAWLQDFATTGRPGQARDTVLAGYWSHAHITAVHPPLVVAYRQAEQNIKIDWIIPHDNAYLDSRSNRTWQGWKDEDKRGSPDYAKDL
jgi:hypothetical protein